METMLGKHSTSPAKKRFKTTVNMEKVLATILWDIHEIILADFTLRGATVTEVVYPATLQRLKEAIRLRKPGLFTQSVL
jgi:hypothetical protein